MYLFDILFKLTKVEKIAKKCYNRNSWTHMCSAIKYGGARICAKRRLFFGSKGWSSSLTWFRSWDSFLAQATWFSPLPSATSGKNGRLLSAKSLRRLTFHKYGHIEIRDSDKEHLKAIYQAILPYMVRNYTHDFVWTCSCAS